MNTDKTLIPLILAFEDIIAAVDFAYLLHHLVHILNACLGILGALWHKSFLAKILTELIGEDNIPFFFSIEVRLKLCLYPLATFPDVIDNNPQLFGYSFLEFKF